MKKITQGFEVALNVEAGTNKIADIVAKTLGPGGLPILIERRGQQLNGEPLPPMITKDGVTVASECFDEDAEVDAVIQTIKDICRKTNNIAGDGTTTAIVLGRAILNKTMNLIENEGVNPQVIKRSLEEAAKEVALKLEELATPCDSLDKLEHVALISANGEKEIASVIRRAFEAVGSEGLITVDEGAGAEHTLDIVNGFQFKRGAELLERFVNNEYGTKFEAENAHIVIYDGKLSEVRSVITILELLYKQYQGKMPPIVFVANEFSPDVIQALLIFKAEQGLSVCLVKGPHTTNVRTGMYDDMAVFLGGTRMGNGNRNLSNIEFDDIGIAGRVVIDKYNTTIFDGAGAEEEVLARIDQLKSQRQVAESPYDSALLSDRIAALGEGIAKIGVGGQTDLEVKEKYHRIEDAINAARAALVEGVVPGGGATLLRIAESLGSDTPGRRILREALKEPFYQILANLGVDGGEYEKQLLSQENGIVIEGNSLQFVPALEAGIIDPVKVTKTALANAISISGLMSTCGGFIVYTRKK